MESKYPEKLLDVIFEHIEDGSEVTTSQNEDTTLFIIRPASLDQWVVLVEWYDWSEDFSVTNVCAKAWDRLYKIMTEENQRLGE